MGYNPKQIGWSVESNLLQELSKQISQLTKVTASGITTTTSTSSTTTTSTTAPPTTTTTTTL